MLVYSVSTSMLGLREEKPMSREDIEQRSLARTRPFSTASIFDDSGCPCATNGSQVPGSKTLVRLGFKTRVVAEDGGDIRGHTNMWPCRADSERVKWRPGHVKRNLEDASRDGRKKENGTDGILRRHTMSRGIPDSWKLVVQGNARRRDVGMWSDGVGWRRVEGYARGVDN